MAKNLIKSLISYGLTANEAAIYVCLLEKLEASVFEIAKETGISRATVYITLEKMKELKLVSLLRKNNVQYFTPENPSRLKMIADEKSSIISEILPELNAIIDTDAEKPDVRLYTGAAGVKIVLEDILETLGRAKERYLLAASRTEILERFPKYFPEWISRRERLKITTKLILPEGERETHAFEPNEFREVKYIPDIFGFKAMIEIYGNKMAVFSLKEGEIYSVVIESEPIIQTFIKFFSFAWDKASQ